MTSSLLRSQASPSRFRNGLFPAVQIRFVSQRRPSYLAPKPPRSAAPPPFPEASSVPEQDEIMFDWQREQYQIASAEAMFRGGDMIDSKYFTLPRLALHIPRKTLPFIINGNFTVAWKVWLREMLERVKDTMHFHSALQHPVLPGMKKRPRWYHFGTFLSMRSVSENRPMMLLRRQALEQYVRFNEMEAAGSSKRLSGLISEPLLSDTRARIAQRGRGVTCDWRFHGEVEPTRCLSFRMMPSAIIDDLPEAQSAAQQVLMRFRTKQSLEVRRNGELISGSHDEPRVVTDYFVLEHKNWEKDTGAGPVWRLRAQEYEIPTPEMLCRREDAQALVDT